VIHFHREKSEIIAISLHDFLCVLFAIFTIIGINGDEIPE
jgi:hypothetical protein